MVGGRKGSEPGEAVARSKEGQVAGLAAMPLGAEAQGSQGCRYFLINSRGE